MKIVVLDGYGLNPGDLSWEELKALGEVTVYDRTAAEDILSRSQGAEILLTNKTPLTRETLQSLPALRFVCVLATGYNVVDIEAAQSLGITVSNIPAYSTPSVAQHVFALLLTITNRVEHYTRQIQEEGRWTTSADFCYWDTPLTELQGKRFGIFGLGRIGQQTALIAQALGMEVVALTSKSQEQLPADIHKVTEEEFLSTCDVITLHCPLTPETHEYINKDRLQRMKPTTILINTSRGPVVDQQAVADALEAGRLGAFAADVLCVEPPTADNPLLHSPRTYLTPHIAWATKEARERLMAIAVGNVAAYQKGEPRNVVS